MKYKICKKCCRVKRKNCFGLGELSEICSDCYSLHSPVIKQKVKWNLKEYTQKLKEKVYNHYGKICVCCKEKNLRFLTIDHINNDGYIDRKIKGISSSRQFYQYIINSRYPNQYQILCWNCNLGKARNNGICPHLTVDKKLQRRLAGRVSQRSLRLRRRIDDSLAHILQSVPSQGSVTPDPLFKYP